VGYFSNGTEGNMYEEKYCNRCVNDNDGKCPIMTLHLLWNYEQNQDEIKKYALDFFIPMQQDGPFNDKCLMFLGVISYEKEIR
jgi:hypothetical protein